DRRPHRARSRQEVRGSAEAMTSKKLREAERALAADPHNLVVRLKLAAALREAGRMPDAVELYRAVAVAYQQEGRLVQALAVCRAILEIAPDDFPTRVLHQEIDAQRTGAPGEEPTRLAADTGQVALTPHRGSRPPVVEVGPDDYDVDDDAQETGER